MRDRKTRQQQNLENNFYLSTRRAFPTLYDSVAQLDRASVF